jgi:hypothetical protein
MRRALSLAAGAAAGLSVATASAQMAHVPINDWRQEDRHDAITRAAAKPTFLVEVRFGAYLPNIDSGVSAGSSAPYPNPFDYVFGFDCGAGTAGKTSPAFLFGLEADYLPLRVPYLGAVGLGLGWAWTHFSNGERQLANPNKCSAEQTTLTIMPMHASVVLRVDELMRRTGIPIVPYGKFGIGMTWWRASNDFGTETACTKDPMAHCMGDPPNAHALGLTPTLHFALGGMIALNFLEPQAAARLDQTTGVHHAYLFGEYFNDQLTLAPNALHVGASSGVGGIAIDF